MKNLNLLRSLGLTLYIAGLVVGLLFYASTAWADYEAQLFDSALVSDEAESTFNCPMIITRAESGTLHATFGNPSVQNITRRVRLHVTDGFITLMREEDTLLKLAPGETQQLTWTVSPQDAAYNLLIMARVFAFRAYLQPARSSSCGILVLPIKFLSGSQVIAIALIFSWLAMAAGGVLWRKGVRLLAGKQLNAAYAMGFLALIVAVGCVTGLAGIWLVSFLMVILAVLMFIALIWFVFAG